MLEQSVSPDAPWAAFYRRWARLRPPLRPHVEVCGLVGRLMAGRAARALLLGVTPELTTLAEQTVAVDHSSGSLARIWPGNHARRRAVQANWLDLPFPAASFTVAIGDGSLNCLEYPQDYRRVFAELSRVIRPGGRVAVRLYATPQPCESLATVRACTLEGEVCSMDTLKWRLAHALCGERRQPNLPVQAIWSAFDRMFPDRAELLDATGWDADDLAHVGAYASLPDVFSFPTIGQVLAVAPRHLFQVRIAETSGYELAERCPMLVMDAR